MSRVFWCVLLFASSVALRAPIGPLRVRKTRLCATKCGAEVFVSNIARKADADALLNALQCYGVIDKVVLPKNPAQPVYHRGFGFVRFKERVAAEAAIASNTHAVMVCGQPLVIREYIKKDVQSNSPRTLLFDELKSARASQDIGKILSQLDGLNNVKEYNIAINAWGRVRAWQRALELLDEMRSHGITPDIISFTVSVAISACGKSG